MPRIVFKNPPKPAGYDRVVQRLVKELKTPSAGLQPLILERIIESTGSRHIHVIWDDWQQLPDEQRSAAICDAYAIAEGLKAADDVTLALGVNPKEAVVLGLLPYKVVSTRKRHEAAPPMAKYKKVMKAEARNTVLGPDADELRYPRLEEAQEAKTRLEKALAGSDWAIEKEIAYE